MITLYTFGPYFGLPDASPFVMKAMTLLKLAGLPYTEDRGGYGKAPKGKLPYIADNGQVIADSTFIRLHLEAAHHVDFDAGLTPEQRAVAWAVEKMCEDHLYWALIDARWCVDANFAKGPAQFFSAIPAPIRLVISALVRRKVRAATKAHGLGRHSRADIERLAARDLDALATLLGEKPYLMGNTPCGADATVFAFVAGVLCPHFDTGIRTAAEAHGNLVAYRDRMLAKYFPVT
jgi:glutathione S-transferase